MIIAALSIILGFVLIVILANLIADHKAKKMKIEAAIRVEELRNGYAPGTYSRSFAKKSAYKAMKKDTKRWARDCKKNESVYSAINEAHEQNERESLEKGIRDLEERIKNLDTILKEKGRN